MDPEEWLQKKAGGYSDLAADEIRAIHHFTFLWSIFEHRLLNDRATVNAMSGLAALENTRGNIRLSDYASALSHFSSRYVDGRELNYLFGQLNFRGNDQEPLVRNVLLGTERDPQHVVTALLLITYRLRNNLFHGSKWDYGIFDQRENFEHANNVLMAVMNPHSLF